MYFIYFAPKPRGKCLETGKIEQADFAHWCRYRDHCHVDGYNPYGVRLERGVFRRRNDDDRDGGHQRFPRFQGIVTAVRPRVSLAVSFLQDCAPFLFLLECGAYRARHFDGRSNARIECSNKIRS